MNFLFCTTYALEVTYRGLIPKRVQTVDLPTCLDISATCHLNSLTIDVREEWAHNT